jgi:hypothetical protein
MNELKESKIRTAVEYFYDLQKLRIASGNRSSAGVETTELDDRDREFLASMGTGLNELEKQALRHVKGRLKGIPIYEKWLKDQKGVGPTMAGVLLAQIDITRCNTPSQLWAYCGLAVAEDGKAVRRKKGEKLKYNPWLKAKVIKVLAESFIKAKSPWREFYDNYKTRKENQLVDKCMACGGSGKIKAKAEKKSEKVESIESAKTKPCSNCEGTGGPCPWGASKAHRHNAAKRYMVKMFLLEFWLKWREIEGLPSRVPYAEEYLNRVHHA